MDKLFCENKFCIYQKQGICILDSVELDIQGNCTNCIYIDIQENALNKLKNKVIKDLQDQSS